MAWYNPKDDAKDFFTLEGRENDKGVAIAEKMLTVLLMASACAALFFFAGPAIVSAIGTAGALGIIAPAVANIAIGVGTIAAGYVANKAVTGLSDTLGFSEKGKIANAAKKEVALANKSAKQAVRDAELELKNQEKQNKKQSKLEDVKLNNLQAQIDSNKDRKGTNKAGFTKHENPNQYYSEKMAGLIRATVATMGKDSNGDLSKLSAEQLAKLSKMVQDTEKRAGGRDNLSEAAIQNLYAVQQQIENALNGKQEKINAFKQAGGKSESVKSTQEIKNEQKIKGQEDKEAETAQKKEEIKRKFETKVQELEGKGPRELSSIAEQLGIEKIRSEITEQIGSDTYSKDNPEHLNVVRAVIAKHSVKAELETARSEEQQAEEEKRAEQQKTQTKEARTEAAVNDIMSELAGVSVSDAKGDAKATNAQAPGHRQEQGQSV